MNCITSVDRNTLVIDLAPFVQKVDSAIHWINLHPVDSVLLSLTLIRWIVVYLVDSAIQLLNNWGLIGQ